MQLLLLLLLAAPDLPSDLGAYLRASPGSQAEGDALARVRVYWEKDRSAVEEALRNHVTFPARKTGLETVTVPLPGVRKEGEPASNPAAVYLPKAYDPAKKWPALLVVHGTSGHADAELQQLSSFAERNGVVLVGPQDTLRKGGGGWGYTDLEHDIHVETLRWLKRNVNVDDKRVFVCGGSRGGHAAWDLAYTYPDIFAGAIPIVGAPKNRFFRYLPNLLHVPLLDLQGAKDQALLVEYLRDAIELLKGWDYDVTYKEDPDSGHYYPVDWGEVWDWMKDRRRPNYPKRVIRVATRNDRSRAYWIRLAGLAEKRFAKPKPAVNKTGGALTRDEQKKLIRDNYENYRGRVEAKVAKGNTIELTVTKSPKITLWLHDDLVNLDEKVTIKVNGRVRTKTIPKCSLETLLSRAKETGDRELLYPASLSIRGVK